MHGRCEDIVNFDSVKDEFVLLSKEEIEGINRDPESPFKIPVAAKEAYINKNKDSPRLAYWKYDSGNVGRAYSAEYNACKDGKKHDGVDDLLSDYGGILEKYESCTLNEGVDGEVCGIIYTVARTGQRIGSRDGSKAGIFKYEHDEKGKPKRIVTGYINTYGVSTLRARHVTMEGDRVTLDFPGKDGQRQHCVFESSVIADFFRRMLEGKGPDDPLFDPHIYRSVKVRFKSDTGHTIKDLRTAMAHLIVPEAKKEWVLEHGEPANKTQEKKMIKYAVDKAAKILGNKPKTLKKSYASPHDLRSRYE